MIRIYFMVCVLLWLLAELMGISMMRQIKRKYNVEIKRRTFLEALTSYIRGFLIFMIPILNLVFFILVLFGTDKLMPYTYRRLLEDNMLVRREVENDESNKA